MIVIENVASTYSEHALLRSMFEARKQVFVDLLGWNVAVIDNRFEVDQFDDAHATYVIVADVNGAHLGSARLLKTTRAHILGDLFPALCAGEVPRSPDTFEITRFCLGRGQGALARRVTRNRLVSALVSYGLAHAIRTFTGVAEMGWLQQILAFGWECRPLGSPLVIGGVPTGALAISITPETPALLERNGIWVGDELIPALAEAA